VGIFLREGKCMEWKEKLSLVYSHDEDWREFSSPTYIYENPNYEGGETKIIKSCGFRISKFLELLDSKNLLSKVKRVELRYSVGNRFRGAGSKASYLHIDKEFAEMINLKGDYEMIDKAWGDYWAELSCNKKALEDLAK
jgi:hypothetical protein